MKSRGMRLGLPGILTAGLAAGRAIAADLPVERIRLPEGFAISVYAANVPGARSLTQGPPGVLFVGTRSEGVVYAVADKNNDGRAESVRVVARGLDTPNGVAWRDGSLFVAEIGRILRIDGLTPWLADASAGPKTPAVVLDTLPKEGHHGWKFIRFGPDGLLYVPVGAPCNVCLSDDPRFAAILRMKPDGTGLNIYSSGVRNTVGFDWHPLSKELWFTDNGRDMMGDERPPDELNRAPKAGMHFGFPFCHGGDILDPRYGSQRPCPEFTPPAQKLGPHVAALGMRFYTGTLFPERYRNQIFLAEHGSWNRTNKIGYRVMLVRLEGAKAVSYEPFAEGWLANERVWGRPVDVQVMPDGALVVSDDYAGALYRIVHRSATGG